METGDIELELVPCGTDSETVASDVVVPGLVGTEAESASVADVAMGLGELLVEGCTGGEKGIVTVSVVVSTVVLDIVLPVSDPDSVAVEVSDSELAVADSDELEVGTPDNARVVLTTDDSKDKGVEIES